MARRSRKHSREILSLGPSLVALAVVGMFGLALLRAIASHLSSYMVVGCGFLAVLILVQQRWSRERKQREQERRYATFRSEVNGIIDRHLQVLVRRRAQLVQNDEYGMPQTKRWMREVEYFIAEHITPTLSGEGKLLLTERREEVARSIVERTFQATKLQPLVASFSNCMSPSEFEQFCAEQLRLSGWQAKLTKGSHDQGVDVIAEQNGVRLVLQCKLYSSSVGNAAVQQIAAGRAHEQAQYGAVVTNCTYTACARELAATNGIMLLHYSDLANIRSAANLGQDCKLSSLPSISEPLSVLVVDRR